MAINELDVLTIDDNDIRREGKDYPEQARELAKIGSSEDNAKVNDWLRNLKAFYKRTEGFFAPMKKQARGVLNEINAREKEILAPLEEAERIVKSAMIAWDSEQERIRQAEEARLRKEAQRQANEARLAAAVEAEQAGNNGIAAAILDTPMVVPEPMLPPIQKAEGAAFIEYWKAEVTDMRLLIMAISQGKASTTLVEVNKVALGQMARAMKGELSIPGVRVWMEKGMSSRAR